VCIICNMGHNENSIYQADRFLAMFRTAGNYMRDAGNQLLVVADLATDPKVGRRYRSLQKKMAKLTKEWNRLEQIREAHVEATVVEKSYSTNPGRLHGDSRQFSG
jgi:hypothetical protein